MICPYPLNTLPIKELRVLKMGYIQKMADTNDLRLVPIIKEVDEWLEKRVTEQVKVNLNIYV